ncbi:GFA family protein [Gilvimarinus agarilyticus]|uniref:GFA family protein n=1 Tax=Gilvimarinus agarilyticus TaxID=679259 RepID=UPI00059F48BA|nr:GFA family protein [Gilvimarinus agarilyticus]
METPNTTEATGSCLCGAVTIHANALKTSVGACHCSMCRKWSGGPLMVLDCGESLTIKGEDNLSRFDSSEWAERAFCKRCGSHLFYRLKPNNLHLVAAGIFEYLDSLVFDHQVFIDEKPEYYAFANQTHNMTGEEVFALFSND